MRIICSFLLLIAVTCSSAGFTQTADSVYLVTQHDRFDATAGAIEDFSIKNNIIWQQFREDVNALARSKGANIVFLKKPGNMTAGHIKGTLYHASEGQIKELLAARAAEEAGCAIVIFRDNGPSLAVYKYDVVINGEAFNDFSDMSFIRKALPACDAVAEVQVKRFRQNIPLKGRTRYFRLMKNVQLAMMGNMVFYSFGGAYSLLEVEGEEQARIICAPLKRHAGL